MIKRRKKKQSTPLTLSLKVNDQPVNVFIHTESRKNSRVSIGKTGIHIRLPKSLPRKMQQQHVEQFMQWAGQTLKKKPHLLIPKEKHPWQSGDTLTVLDQPLTLDVVEADRKTGTAQVIGEQLIIKIPSGMVGEERSAMLTTLISRALAKRYHAVMWERLSAINSRYYQKPLNSLRLKYTTSRWGSCSTKGNINLSTRLLLAPKAVRDYIMVHELAHLVHHNHSKAFWNEVARVMPHYKEQERWLKDHGKQCDF